MKKTFIFNIFEIKVCSLQSCRRALLPRRQGHGGHEAWSTLGMIQVALHPSVSGAVRDLLWTVVKRLKGGVFVCFLEAKEKSEK